MNSFIFPYKDQLLCHFFQFSFHSLSGLTEKQMCKTFKGFLTCFCASSFTWRCPDFPDFFMFILLRIGNRPNTLYVFDFYYLCDCCVYEVASFVFCINSINVLPKPLSLNLVDWVAILLNAGVLQRMHKRSAVWELNAVRCTSRGLKHAACYYAACRPRVVRKGILCAPRWENFRLIKTYVMQFIHRCLKVLGQRVNKFLLKERRDGQKRLAYNSRYISQEIRCKKYSSKVKIPSLLRQPHNAALGLS